MGIQNPSIPFIHVFLDLFFYPSVACCRRPSSKNKLSYPSLGTPPFSADLTILVLYHSIFHPFFLLYINSFCDLLTWRAQSTINSRAIMFVKFSNRTIATKKCYTIPMKKKTCCHHEEHIKNQNYTCAKNHKHEYPRQYASYRTW